MTYFDDLKIFDAMSQSLIGNVIHTIVNQKNNS